jgi:hypothetical protein
MATPAPRRRKPADAAKGATVKSSLIVSRHLHCRWHAAASLSGMTANAFAVEALTVALRGIVVHDRRKLADRAMIDDRRTDGDGSNLDADDQAA